MELIRIENLYFSYKTGTQTLLEDISDFALCGIDLKIHSGEWVAIIGANGSGKSTLLKQLNALLLPTKGDVWISGHNTRDITSLRQIRSSVGMVFQVPDTQIITTVVEEEVAFGPENLGVSEKELRERVERALEITGLSPLRNRSPQYLSEGQKQLLAIASILAMNPGCLVLDEATSMLDPRSRENVLSTVRKLHGEGMTVVTATHNMDEAAQAQRIIVLSEGRIEFDAGPTELFSKEKLLSDLKLGLPYPAKIASRLKYLLENDPATLLTINALSDAIVMTLQKRGVKG
ncbi:MAG: ATP-binding cassette domain-containing protein [Spirochaetota bacterium]|nr:MAG: ATP-binding cassette domain-containing protein [Spirochaetota bacterium]